MHKIISLSYKQYIYLKNQLCQNNILQKNIMLNYFRNKIHYANETDPII
jgi:hypothetical protein